MTQQCRYCGDFYRSDDNEMAIETELRGKGVLGNLEVTQIPYPSTDDGWIIDICRQCQTEFNIEAQALDEAWQLYYQQLDEGEPQ